MHRAEPLIRMAEPGDVTAIARLYLEVADEVAAREPSLRHVPHAVPVKRRYASRVGEADRVVLVAVADGAVIGFVDVSLQKHEDKATYHRPGVDAYVEELIVAASRRGRGIATALMRAAEARARDGGARTLFLDTHVTNKAARAFYGAIGNREFGVMLLKEL